MFSTPKTFFVLKQVSNILIAVNLIIVAKQFVLKNPIKYNYN
jgi:hypothetical protein